jgi:hypothetical protein
MDALYDTARPVAFRAPGVNPVGLIKWEDSSDGAVGALRA